jgi:hypothetical protein
MPLLRSSDDEDTLAAAAGKQGDAAEQANMGSAEEEGSGATWHSLNQQLAVPARPKLDLEVRHCCPF